MNSIAVNSVLRLQALGCVIAVIISVASTHPAQAFRCPTLAECMSSCIPEMEMWYHGHAQMNYRDLARRECTGKCYDIVEVRCKNVPGHYGCSPGSHLVKGLCAQ